MIYVNVSAFFCVLLSLTIVLAKISTVRRAVKTQTYNRKHFLRGKLNSELSIRPPWSINELEFTEQCTRCYKCAESCPSNLIVKGMGGYPEISFIRQGCDYCEACARSCPEDVLNINHFNKKNPWQQQASINDECFSMRGIVCRSCGEVCEARAIEFKLVVGGKSQLILNTTACNGCGECVHVCPADAITVHKINLNESISSPLESLHE